MTSKSILCFQQICRIRRQSGREDQCLVLDRHQKICSHADPLFRPVCVKALRKINPPSRLRPVLSHKIHGLWVYLFPARPDDQVLNNKPIMETAL